MTMNSKNEFFVELQPCGSFFFGNERTFNTAEVDKYREEITNYFAISNMLPQQTAILGLLRHALLSLYGKLSSPINDKQTIIGAHNFDGSHNESFGYISSISPLVIAKKYNDTHFEFLQPVPFTKQNEVQLIYSEISSPSLDQNKKQTTPKLDNFNYKGFSTDLMWQNQNGEIEKNPIFYELTKVGVNKNEKVDSFYKQTFYGLEKGYSFGVWVSFTENIDENKLKSIIMPFGADQGLFKIVFHKNIPDVFNSEEKHSKCLYFISDAFVENEFYQYIDFAISDFTDFRYIKSKKEKFYQISNKGENDGDKSKKIRLLKRGSVVFTSKSKDLVEYLEGKKAFRNIGYNYYKFI